MLRAAMMILLCSGGALLRADQVQMQNGDHFSGNIVLMTPNAVVLQNENLGKITLPREKVASISLGSTVSAAPVAAPATAAPAPNNSSADVASALRGLGANTNAINQVKKQFLEGAGPEAAAKFDDLLGGLTTGKLDINGLRAQAKSAADQLRALRKDGGGGDAGGMLDEYLNILDSFLAESATTSSVNTNSSQGTTTITR